ncbi:GNAT family N-acetyltransferase [Georgenia sp. SYP-B2076]|uniref:GNAT family N-acetyltransferase n=1 Tax=Georgenia sp. SYP-B2076 TaxID=2495881 RepID=UPI000F8CA899|nr:GNAT family N-acetyltransferase [Georgenia sp. SYP-B2076]
METVTQNKGQFEIVVDGTTAGLTQFVDDDGLRIFFHTETGKEYAGQGLAGRLVARALEETRAAGLRVVPVCPYVAAYVGRHHEYDDLARPVTRRALRIVRDHELTLEAAAGPAPGERS